ncbi:hypothetical protein LUZ61_019793 [Rhynchospora tenuis]|uniref:Helicase C-terminal domain-containing protein n=1 Tax=Rhynchospora tenuis TaxID=198213 RepID=A0AAD5ZC39_9POAL|nr:hypothetical protein LUZ61_019793 [Rhynchospora tenuis]
MLRLEQTLKQTPKRENSISPFLSHTVAMDDEPQNEIPNRSPEPMSLNQGLRHQISRSGQPVPAPIPNPNSVAMDDDESRNEIPNRSPEPMSLNQGLRLQISRSGQPVPAPIPNPNSDLEEKEKSEFTMEGLLGTEVVLYKLPYEIYKKLLPHQREGIDWLWTLHCLGTGGILGDDIGLGKTMQEGRILITTYGIVRKDYKLIRGGNKHDHDLYEEEDELLWDYVILDEGHTIRNLKTQTAESLHQIPSQHRIIITGTLELWALFNFCCPEVLGDKDKFKDMYENKIMRGNEKNANELVKYIGSAAAEDLRKHIAKYFLRRLKSEVFGKENEELKVEILEKNDLIIWLKLTTRQRQIYEAFLKNEILLTAAKGSPLAAITDALLLGSYKMLRINGTTKIAERDKIIQDFQEGNGAPIFLLITQVGALGLTLTRADRVIIVDPSWNPSIDNQTADRAHRISQTKNVIVYRLVFKTGLFKAATEKREQIRYFSIEDMEEVFRLPEEGFDVSVAQRQLQEEHAGQVVILLFPKTAILAVVPETNDSDRAAFAQKPPNMTQNASSSSQTYHVEESPEEILEQINRISTLLAKKNIVANLPDQGERLRKRLTELQLKLQAEKTVHD